MPDLRLDPGVGVALVDAAGRSDLAREQLSGLHVQAPLAVRQTRWVPEALEPATVAHEFRQVRGSTAGKLCPALLDPPRPRFFASGRFSSERLLHVRQLCIVDNCAQALGDVLDWQRDAQTRGQLDDDAFA